MKCSKEQCLWAILRLCMGWTFLWAFMDKLFGLGFSTCRDVKTQAINYMCEQAWVNGGSPTFGFLKFAVKGPFASFFQGLAGSALVEWLFMLGLLFAGLTLMFGIMVRLGSYTGVLLLILMYSAGFIWPEHNPFVDEHIIYAFVLLGISFNDSCRCCCFFNSWQSLNFVKKYKILQ